MVVGHTLPDSRLPGTNKSHAGKPRITIAMRYGLGVCQRAPLGSRAGKVGMWPLMGMAYCLLTRLHVAFTFRCSLVGRHRGTATSALPCLSAVWATLQLGYLAR